MIILTQVKPYNFVDPPKEGPQRNFGAEDHTVTINDIRGHESDYTLDNNAFSALQNIPSAMTYEDWEDEDKIKSVYYDEVEQLLLSRVPGAKRIFLFDHTIRRTRPNSHRAPVTRVHIDQTARSTQWRVELHMGGDAPALLQRRYRIINVWRPLNGPVFSHPLGFADCSSVRGDHLVGVEHRYPHRTGETAAVKFDAAQRWNYWSGMENDERLFLLCFDSDDEGRRVPHTAFVDKRTPDGAPGRESIEVRALVFD